LNQRAIEKAARQPMPPGTEIYGFRLHTSIELNKETMAEITAAADAAAARGEDPRRALHMAASQWNPKEHPERYDYVVVNVGTVGRPSALLPDPNQVPTATILLGEHIRMPLQELRGRADDAFEAAETANRGALQ
jgi:hypothetical protein